MNDTNHHKAFEQFCRRAENARLIPLSSSLVADLDTPLTLFFKVNPDREHVFLFESMEGGEKWGRYSFIGFQPLVSFESTGDSVEVCSYSDTSIESRRFTTDPLSALRSLVGEMDAYIDPDLPRFCGGAVGFLGYDMVRFMEDLPDHHEKLHFPDSSFIVPGTVLIHDSFEQTVTIVHWVDTGLDQSPEKLYEAGRRQIEQITNLINQPVSADFFKKHGDLQQQGHAFNSNMEPGDYHRMVEQACEYILAGDIFQVVLSQRFYTTTNLPAHSIYRALRHINPSPYLFYLKLGDLIQIGSSPEILVRKEGDRVELRPIAGTRPRGRSEEEDVELEKELLADPKERAEHLMLVDLGRNDVGRIARPGTVQVKDLLVIERYSHVMHIVSGVHGVIDDGKDMFDVVEACFPAGTVSGAPKIRAMEIIEELEPGRRGPYGGSVGYFGFSGNMDFCITIRTFIMHGQELFIQAGAGIVADSQPHREFEETVNKSMGLRRAVEMAEKRF